MLATIDMLTSCQPPPTTTHDVEWPTIELNAMAEASRSLAHARAGQDHPSRGDARPPHHDPGRRRPRHVLAGGHVDGRRRRASLPRRGRRHPRRTPRAVRRVDDHVPGLIYRGAAAHFAGLTALVLPTPHSRRPAAARASRSTNATAPSGWPHDDRPRSHADNPRAPHRPSQQRHRPDQRQTPHDRVTAGRCGGQPAIPPLYRTLSTELDCSSSRISAFRPDPLNAGPSAQQPRTHHIANVGRLGLARFDGQVGCVDHAAERRCGGGWCSRSRRG